jgi:hypothetical protein
MPAKAVSGLASLSANQTTSFFLVSWFGSGAYSAKLLNGTKQRFSGFSQGDCYTGLVVMALRNASGEVMVVMVRVPSPTP